MKNALVVISITLLAMVFVSCSEEKASDDRAEIMALINGQYANYFSGSGASGDSEPGGGNGIDGMNATATQPQAWWREIDTGTRVITIDFPYDGHADVEVDDTLHGRLYVDRRFDLVLDPGVRAFTCKRTKYSTFDKLNGVWTLTGVSMGRWYMADSVNQNVKITSMRVTASNYDKTFTDPTIVIPLDEWPTFKANETITVTAVTTNSTASGFTPKTFSYLHHPIYNREPMIEEPTNTFTESFPATVWAWGWGFLCPDAIDSETLQTESGTYYNWDVWVMPYQMETAG